MCNNNNLTETAESGDTSAPFSKALNVSVFLLYAKRTLR